METWSGIPAFSNEHREYYNRRRAELSSKMREYIGCHDLARLPLPFLNETYNEFRIRDIKTRQCHPVQLSLLCGRASKKEEDDHSWELESAREADLVSPEDYAVMRADIDARKARRLACLHGLMKE
jgi:hypothetical protein